MPEIEFDMITKELLQSELRSDGKNLIILDCRSSNEYVESHIRSAVNFSIPSIMLRRLSAGKIDLLSTIKSPELKDRIENNYKLSLFVLYNDNCYNNCANQFSNNGSRNNESSMSIILDAAVVSAVATNNDLTNTQTTINVLHRRLKQDGCRVVCLQDGFSSFRDAFPEWCEEDNYQTQDMNESSRSGCVISGIGGQTQADQLMGLRSLRISTPHSDSACSSSAESSDCESTTYPNFNDAPVEIVPGLFLGNASHSGDSKALENYNIKYVLNVTPDLPNVFEASGEIKYLKIPITDHYSQDLAVHFPVAIQFIEEAQSNGSAVLVHCLAGVSRSVTVTLAYLMSTHALNLNEAFNLVRDRKPDVSPNFHFMEQLYSFEQQLRIESGNTMDSSDGNINNNNNAINFSHIPSTSSSAAVVAAAAERAKIICTSGVGGSTNNTINNSKFSCRCIETDCKCMIESAVDFLATTSSVANKLKATGVSPDSGIEFDRWTPSSDGGLK